MAASTGINVSDSTNEPANANSTVSAIGLKSFPFRPLQGQDRQVDHGDDQLAEHRRLADFDGRIADDLVRAIFLPPDATAAACSFRP